MGEWKRNSLDFPKGKGYSWNGKANMKQDPEIRRDRIRRME